MNVVPVPTAEPQQWLVRFGNELYRYALGRVADETAAEELVQETFVSALEALDSFRSQASERTWLFVILKRKLIDYYRRQARSPLVALDLPLGQQPEATYFEPGSGHWRAAEYPQPWSLSEEAGRGDMVLEQQELQQVLRACQARLPAQQLAVFQLRFVEELPAAEICQELRLSPANYWVLVHRAKLQLRRCLEKNWFQAPTRR